MDNVQSASSYEVLRPPASDFFNLDDALDVAVDWRERTDVDTKLARYRLSD